MSKFDQYGITFSPGKQFDQIFYSLVLIYNILHNNISNHLKQYGLSPGKFNILMTVKHQGKVDGISQVDISKHLIVTPSNMTKLLDKLEKEEFVTRSALENDRRVNIIRITKKGSDLLNDIWPGYNALLQNLTETLPADKQKQLASLLLEWFGKLSQQ